MCSKTQEENTQGSCNGKQGLMELSGLFLSSYRAGLWLSDDSQHSLLGSELLRAGLGVVSLVTAHLAQDPHRTAAQ